MKTNLDKPDNPHPWERQPDETMAAFSAFQRFLLMEPPRRIFRFVENDSSASESTINGYSKRHKWTQRSEAWDAHMLKMLTNAAETRVQTYGEKAGDALAQMQIDRTLARARMLSLARQCLDRLKPEDLKPSDALLIIDLDAKLSKLDAGMPTEIVEVRAKRDAREVAELPESYKDRIRFGGEWWEDVLDDWHRDLAQIEQASSPRTIDITPTDGQDGETGDPTDGGEAPSDGPDFG